MSKGLNSIVILSGEIASGKSSIAKCMENDLGYKRFRTRDLIQQEARRRRPSITEKELSDRAFMQRFGTELDKDTNGEWVLNALQSVILDHERVLIDAARIHEQIMAFRHAYEHLVVHIHAHAQPEKRREWYIERTLDNEGGDRNQIGEKFDTYSKDETELRVNHLKALADLIIYTPDTKNINDYSFRVAGFLRLLPNLTLPCVDVVVGGQFGSEGKGQVAAYLATEYDCLIRVGGPNAGHKVYREISGKPMPDVFHMFPSGSKKNQQAQIVIGPGAVLYVPAFLEELKRHNLEHNMGRILIDENATCITERDKELESELDNIGSTKQGVGAATALNLLQHRLGSSDKHKAKNAKELTSRSLVGSAQEVYQGLFQKGKKILLEGTQGTLLSLHHGMYPNVTSRETTVNGCLADAGIGPRRLRKIIMVVRRYPIRVQNPTDGTSGGFGTEEITLEEISRRSGIPLDELKKIEKTTTTKKERRIAEFGWDLFRKACELNTPTDIALTFADYIDINNRTARTYGNLKGGTTNFIEDLERCAGVPVSLIATRFHYRSIIDRRNWI